MLKLRKESGFTLIELMTVVGIIAILLAIAVPGVMSWLPSYRLKAAAQDMVGNFQKARLEAIKRNALCTVVFNQPVDGVTYDYVVFIDDPENGVDRYVDYDDGSGGTTKEEIIEMVRWEDYRSVDFDTTEGGGNGVNFAQNDDGRPALAYKPNGLTRSDSGALGAGSVFLVNTKGVKRRIVISSVGNIRIE